jgi:hypothetical protein
MIGFLGLAPAFVSGPGSPAELAVGIGGILLAHRVLKKLTMGLQHLVGAFISWKRVAPLFHAASRSQTEQAASPASIAVSAAPRQQNVNSVLFEAHDLTFYYPQRSRCCVAAIFELRWAIGSFWKVLLGAASPHWFRFWQV